MSTSATPVNTHHIVQLLMDELMNYTSLIITMLYSNHPVSYANYLRMQGLLVQLHWVHTASGQHATGDTEIALRHMCDSIIMGHPIVMGSLQQLRLVFNKCHADNERLTRARYIDLIQQNPLLQPLASEWTLQRSIFGVVCPLVEVLLPDN